MGLKYLSEMKTVWDQYKQRFVPWMTLRINSSSAPAPDSKLNDTYSSVVTTPRISHVTKGQDALIKDEDVIGFLNKFLPTLSYHNGSNQIQTSNQNKQTMFNHLGFSVSTGPSKIAGTGVFVDKGVVLAGSIVALYPGTIYQPHEPLLLQSIANPYIFRCADGLLIDGNHRGISKSIFRSCALRDQFNYMLPACDISWLGHHPVNPLNIGQYVNDRTSTNNVVYQECFVTLPKTRESLNPTELPASYWKFIPNVWSNPKNNSVGLKVIPLVAVKDIVQGEELVSTYLTFIY